MSEPLGLTNTDNLKNCLARADSLSSPTSYCGQLVYNKDLRRIVLLAYEYRKLQSRNKELEKKLEACKKGWTYPCSDGSHPSFYKTIVTSPQWKNWEKNAFKAGYDWDECTECNWFSQEHFQEFMKFCHKQLLEGESNER